MDFRKLRIAESQDWKILLHQDQTCPGRLYFWYKNESQDLLDIPEDALLDFFRLALKVKKILSDIFQPDMFNYLSLNNRTKHLHIHLIPRYSRKIEKFGLVFEDTSYGKDYKTNPDFKVTEDVLTKIKDLIKF